jgi:hypothetical protein
MRATHGSRRYGAAATGGGSRSGAKGMRGNRADDPVS